MCVRKHAHEPMEWVQTRVVKGKSRQMTQTGSMGIVAQDFRVPFRNLTCSKRQQLERGGALTTETLVDMCRLNDETHK